jgi:hypothetical protein
MFNPELAIPDKIPALLNKLIFIEQTKKDQLL